MRQKKIIPIVLHRLVMDGSVQYFEDVEITKFKNILLKCRGSCIMKYPHDHIKSSEGDLYLITFDDGNLSDFTYALPLLIELDCFATFFIIVERVGTPNYMTWDQIKELHTNGMIIGSHSLSHPDMTLIDYEAQMKEMSDSKAIIEDKLGIAINCFSFPYGKYNKGLLDLAADLGYQSIFTSSHGVLKLLSPVSPRNSINSSMSNKIIMKTLEANRVMLFKWQLEDVFKKLFKLILSDEQYIKFRSAIVRGVKF